MQQIVVACLFGCRITLKHVENVSFVYLQHVLGLGLQNGTFTSVPSSDANPGEIREKSGGSLVY